MDDIEQVAALFLDAIRKNWDCSTREAVAVLRRICDELLDKWDEEDAKRGVK